MLIIKETAPKYDILIPSFTSGSSKLVLTYSTMFHHYQIIPRKWCQNTHLGQSPVHPRHWDTLVRGMGRKAVWILWWTQFFEILHQNYHLSVSVLLWRKFAVLMWRRMRTGCTMTDTRSSGPFLTARTSWTPCKLSVSKTDLRHCSLPIYVQQCSVNVRSRVR